MNSEAAQTISPADHSGQSRLMATIIGLIALAFVLAAVFIYLQSGEKIQPPSMVLTAQAKAQYVSEMEQVIQSQPAIPADQKAALIQAMSEKLQVKK